MYHRVIQVVKLFKGATPPKGRYKVFFHFHTWTPVPSYKGSRGSPGVCVSLHWDHKKEGRSTARDNDSNNVI